MPDPLMGVATAVRETPQSQPIPGRTDQVVNNAGGYVFAVDDWTRLHRFLIMGSEGGTYYVGEHELTADNAGVLFRLIDTDGPKVVEHVVRVSEEGSAPKQSPTLFSLAACASLGNDATKRAALDAIPRVCRTGTMLFQFVGYTEKMRGWGRSMCRGVGEWYLRDVEQVAYQAVKYRQREGWTHRDLLRLSHPATDEAAHKALFDWMCGRYVPGDAGVPPIVHAYEAVQAAETASEVVALIREHRLPWEALPDRWINAPEVLDALLDHMGATALLRNLPRYTRAGLITPMAKLDSRFTRLADVEVLRKARVHPVAVLNALFGYKSGQGRSGASWTPVAKVVDLLDAAFYASFGAVESSGKRTMISIDISDSMTWPEHRLSAMPALDCRQASMAMAMTTVRTEEAHLVTAFSHDLVALDISPRQRLDDVIHAIRRLPVGGTDCSLPMVWAARYKVPVDIFVIYTDNETWAGRAHPMQALRLYREQMGIDARLAVNGMASTGFSIADPTDAGSLDLVGFDSATPQILTEFARGVV